MPEIAPPLDKLAPTEAWQPWRPDDRQPWNLKWAGHLYRRAAFGASLARHNFAEGVTSGTVWSERPRGGEFDAIDVKPAVDPREETPKPPPPDAKWDVAQLVKGEKATTPAAVVDVLLNVYPKG